ncbi:MAG: hypothetical protein WC333_03790 [Dehalococcoidia bacterium]|jgi:hypothetical protein
MSSEYDGVSVGEGEGVGIAVGVGVGMGVDVVAGTGVGEGISTGSADLQEELRSANVQIVNRIKCLI